MKLRDICSFLDSAIPLSFQESYDNSGLQAGLPDMEVTSALITLDVTEEIIGEAVKKGCNLVISHHPLLFSPLKKITGNSSLERIVMSAIKENIAIYSAHTNLDSVENGVSWKMAAKLGLKHTAVLSPLKNRLLKLVTYVPESHLEQVSSAIFDAGAGFIGKYDRCGFRMPGTGSFRGGQDTNPFSGEKGKVNYEKEIRFETILYTHQKDKVISALLETHPYEEVAYDIYSLENENTGAGLGCIGELENECSEAAFLKEVADVFGSKGLRYSPLTGRPLRRIALCGGSGASLIPAAKAMKADAFITADIKYHNFFDAEGKLLLVDIGHYESEFFSAELLYDLIVKKFPKFAVRFSETNTNPINYL